MNRRLSSLLLALGLGISASLAMAEAPAPAPAPGAKAQPAPQPGGDMRRMDQGRRMPRAKPESFTEETVRKMADGRVFKTQIEQKVGEGSFFRKVVSTNPEGKTATRTVTATLNKEKNTWSHKIEGVDFDGTAWSRSKESQAAPHDDDDAPQERPQPRKGKKGN
jgi:hypothetical protein